MRVELDIVAQAAGRKITDLSRQMQNLRPAMRQIGSGIIAEAQQSFRDSRDPYKTPWAPLKPATLRARRKGAGEGAAKPLLDTGRLRNSLAQRSPGPASVEVGTNVRYAAPHQFGANIKFAPRSLRVRLRDVKLEDGTTVSRFAKDRHKKARVVWGTNAAGWEVNIPARPFLAVAERGLPASYAELIQAEITEHLRRVVGA